MTSAFYSWKQYAVSVSINGLELRSNAGSKEKLFDLQAAKIEQSSLSLMDRVATDIFTDGNGNGNRNIVGLAAMNETAPGTASYASVPIANTAWRNQSITTVGSAAVNLIPNLRTLINDCTQGKGAASTAPDYLITTQAVHEAFEAVVQPQVRYTPNPSGGADAGIEKLKFKGATLEWSDYCTSGELHALNSRHITLFVHRDANFKMAEGGFMRPVNQDAFTAQILAMLNLATDNRRKNGKLSGIT